VWVENYTKMLCTNWGETNWAKIYISWDGINISNFEKYCTEQVYEDQQCDSFTNLIPEDQVISTLSEDKIKCEWKENNAKSIKNFYCTSSQWTNHCRYNDYTP
jgi:hypothetical protein